MNATDTMGARSAVGRRKKDGRPETPEELAYREAERIAKARVRFLGHATAWGATVLLVLVQAGFESAIGLAFAWGIGLAIHGFFSMIAPGLRRRWTDEEVHRHLGSAVSSERRSNESRHARSLEQLSAQIAHEIRNPITAAKSLVQQMAEDPQAPENAEYAKVALEELERVERSISHLLRYARDEEPRFSEVNLAEVVGSALDTFRDRLDATGVRIERDLDDAGRLSGDPEKLRRVVINLVGNALDAVEEAGTADPAIAVRTGQNLAGNELWLRVEDNGPGIEPERLEKIWSPFHTSKDRGTGLGLAISKKAIEAHGGTIEVSSRVGGGTEFVVALPKNRAEGRTPR